MLRVLIIGVAWLACTAIVTVIIGRAIRRADARREQEALTERRARSTVPATRDRAGWAAVPRAGGPRADPVSPHPVDDRPPDESRPRRRRRA